MNDLPTIQTENLPRITQMHETIEFCKMLATAPYYHKMGAGGVLAVYLTATELGLPVMACLNGGLYTFDGKVTISAQMLHYLIIKNGHKVEILSLNDKECELEFFRSDRSYSYKHKFTIEDAQRAGLLSKDNWKKYPRDMLFNRCLTSGARKQMPDVLINIYTFEEVGIEVEVERQPQHTSEKIIKFDAKTQKPEELKQKVELKQDSLQLKSISTEQHTILQELLDKTTQEFKDNLFKYAKKEWSIEFLIDLPEIHFSKVKKWMEQTIASKNIQKVETSKEVDATSKGEIQ